MFTNGMTAIDGAVEVSAAGTVVRSGGNVDGNPAWHS
jgi:hypothetical protein